MYREVQVGWMMNVLLLCGVAQSALAYYQTRSLAALLPLIVLLVALLVVSSLTITGDEDGIGVRLGPGLVKRRVAWRDIRGCKRCASGLRGLGIKWLGNGWLFKVKPGDHLEIELNNGRVLGIGTSRPDQVIAFIRAHVDVS